MTLHPVLPRYTLGEEIANSVTHGVGILLAITALVVMTAFAASRGESWHVVTAVVFGAALVLCYTTSTLYHAIPIERVKQVLRILDHSAIFLLIAGTYTPIVMACMPGFWGWTLLSSVWMVAVAGIILRLCLRGRFHGLVVALYIVMGWAVVLAIGPILERMGSGGLALLAGGGLAYTVGVVFYRWKSLPYSHAVWHGFVMAGSALHFFAVLFYVIP